MIITTKINMDLRNCHNIPVVDAVQTDSYCRDLELSLYDGAQPFVIPADVQVELRYKKADGKSGLYDTLPNGQRAWKAEENRLTVALTPQMLTFPGAVALTVTLVREAVRLNSFPIALQVSPAAKAVKVESEDYFQLSGFLKGPQARRGQFLRVAEVDSNGNAKTLEAADVEAQLDEAQVRKIVDEALAENPPQDGVTPELSVGEVETLAPDADATASITGTAENPVLNLGIPGAVKPELSIGQVETLAPDADATASITGTAEKPVLNLGIPGAVKPELSIGQVETLAPDAEATASITGTAEKPVLNLGIPGAVKPELSIGQVETLAPDAEATATITGTAEKPVLNLGIPGAVKPELSIGQVETLAPDAEATASITGTAENPVLNLGIPSATEQIPAHWQTALEQGAKAINTALLAAGQERSAFLFYSDAHWNHGAKVSPALLQYLYRHTGLNKTFFGGDIVNDEGDDYDTMEYLWQWRQKVKDLPNHHSVVGNHDDGNATNNRFPEQYVYGYLLAPEETADMHTDGKGLYYYVDRPGERTRYLCLDTAYEGVTNVQSEFVRQALLTTPDGWHIVAVAHIWVDMDYSVTPPAVGDINSEAAKLLALFDSYNARSGAFATCGGWVEFCIGGHTHLDLDRTSPNGIPVILVETDSFHVRSGLPYGAGTANEASVNGIVADYAAHTVHVIRIGRGESRDVTIVNYPVSYTNLLPLATDEDGNIYNGIGYKPDTRWSGSSNAAVTATGKYLSGYIPYNAGQTVYMKNLTFKLDSASSCVHRFAEPGNRLASQNGGEVEAYFTYAVDENGNVTQFTVPTSGTYTQTNYLRIECTQMNERSIITVDEPIE